MKSGWNHGLCPIFLLFLFFCLGCSAPPQDPENRPNVLLITIDTTRADYLGCYGSPDVKTPNIDRLAASGVQFMKNIAPSGTTNPSHTSILTGLYPARHGVYDNETKLDKKAVMLSEIFQQEGYSTLAAVSVRHLNNRHCRLGQGFDVFLPCEPFELKARDRNRPLFQILRWKPIEPFFLWVHYFDPHGTYDPPEPYDKKYPAEDFFEPVPHSNRMNVWNKNLGGPVDPDKYIALYKGEISYLDEQIGKLLKLLKELDVEKNTLVILVADHGESMTEKEIYFCHAGMYNPVYHVPLIMRLPGKIPKGHKVQALTSSVDIFPTALELVGIQRSTEDLDGKSLIPTFADPNCSTHPYIFCEAVGGIIRGVHEGEYKYIKPYPWDWAVTEDHLFRPFEDYKEERDLKQVEPQRAERMKKLLDTWVEVASEGRLESQHLDDIDDETVEALRALGYMR